MKLEKIKTVAVKFAIFLTHAFHNSLECSCYCFRRRFCLDFVHEYVNTFALCSIINGDDCVEFYKKVKFCEIGKDFNSFELQFVGT